MLFRSVGAAKIILNKNLTDENLDLQIKNIISYPQIMKEMGKRAEKISGNNVEKKIYEEVKKVVKAK